MNHKYWKGSLKMSYHAAKNYPLVFYSLRNIPRVSLEFFGYRYQDSPRISMEGCRRSKSLHPSHVCKVPLDVLTAEAIEAHDSLLSSTPSQSTLPPVFAPFFQRSAERKE